MKALKMLIGIIIIVLLQLDHADSLFLRRLIFGSRKRGRSPSDPPTIYIPREMIPKQNPYTASIRSVTPPPGNSPAISRSPSTTSLLSNKAISPAISRSPSTTSLLSSKGSNIPPASRLARLKNGASSLFSNLKSRMRIGSGSNKYQKLATDEAITQLGASGATKNSLWSRLGQSARGLFGGNKRMMQQPMRYSPIEPNQNSFKSITSLPRTKSNTDLLADIHLPPPVIAPGFISPPLSVARRRNRPRMGVSALRGPVSQPNNNPVIAPFSPERNHPIMGTGSLPLPAVRPNDNFLSVPFLPGQMIPT